MRAPAVGPGPALAASRLLRPAETVGVNLVALREPAEALDLAGERIEFLRNPCERGRPLIHTARQYGLHSLTLELQHQLLRPGQLRLHEFELIVGQLRATRRG